MAPSQSNRGDSLPKLSPITGAITGPVAGRYRYLRDLHGNGESDVFLAEDELREETVCVKLLPEQAGQTELRAEVSALRLLHVPGVARFLDEGVHAGRPFVVMEFIDGSTFPGKVEARTWACLEQRVLALVAIIARIHNRGVIHRDLKPDNVLVDAKGNPWVLDFGFSSGAAIGSGHGVDVGAAGTPAYAAPEQLIGEKVDTRADLFSLGVMILEALTGCPEELPSDLDGFFEQRIHQPAPRVRELLPDCPAYVCSVLDQLLERSPANRPRSARDVLRSLRLQESDATRFQVPWLGSDSRFDHVLGVLERERGVALVGDVGTGKSRWLQEIGRRWQADGKCWVALDGAPPNGVPRLDLGHVGGSSTAEALWTIDNWHLLGSDAKSWLEQQLLRATKLGGRFCIATADSCPADVPKMDITALAVGDLEALFEGPDRLFHIKRDGAEELFARTHGNARRVKDEVASWVRAGLAQWSGGQVAMDRRALGALRIGAEAGPVLEDFRGELNDEQRELLTWVCLSGRSPTVEGIAEVTGMDFGQALAALHGLEALGALRVHSDLGLMLLAMPPGLEDMSEQKRAAAHAKLAAQMNGPSPERLQQKIAAKLWAEVVHESRLVAKQLADEGQLTDAEATLVMGLTAANRGKEPAAELLLLEQWVMVALGIFTPLALDRVLYELAKMRGRCPSFEAELAHLEGLSRAALLVLSSGGSERLLQVQAVDKFSNPEMERWRLALCVQAARGASEAQEEELLGEIAITLGPSSTPALKASFAEWMGRLNYRKGQPLAAAEHFEKAHRDAPTQSQKLSALLNGASALLDAGRPSSAASLARQARDVSIRVRHTLFEVRSEWILRTAGYQMGDMDEVDLDLVDAAGRIQVSDQEALVCLTEAAIAWRCGSPLGAALAHRAANLWDDQGKVWASLLARSLEAACAEVAPHLPWIRPVLLDLAGAAVDCPDLLIAAQSLALIRMCTAGDLPELAEVAEEFSTRLGAERGSIEPSARREVLSVSEVLRSLGELRQRS